mgnify:CR=1 FL=1
MRIARGLGAALRGGVLLLVLRATAAAQSVALPTLSPTAIADSQAVLAQLGERLREAPRDAAAWHRRGRIAWVLSEGGGSITARGLDAIRLRHLADSSLRIAAQLAPDNARYQLDLGRFFRGVQPTPTRFLAEDHLRRAMQLAGEAGDEALLAEAAMVRGRLHWLRYDAEVHEAGVRCGELSPQLGVLAERGSVGATVEEDARPMPSVAAMKLLHNILVRCPSGPGAFPEVAYRTAEESFRAAMLASRYGQPAVTQLVMLLAERNRWTELAALARDRATANVRAAEPWSWLGLALHRSGDRAAASAAFDSSLARLDPAERTQLFSLTRILSRSDSARFAVASAAERARIEQAFWRMADPLWSRDGGDPRTEFLARVVFAELRWSVEELSVRGADTDRGGIYVRYGPPDLVKVFRGCAWSTSAAMPPCVVVDADDATLVSAEPRVGGEGVAMAPPRMPGQSDVLTFWSYEQGPTVVFWGAPTLGTARVPMTDIVHVEAAIEEMPASFANAAPETIVAAPVQVARFRSASDSVDVIVATSIPAAIFQSDVANAAAVGHLMLMDVDGQRLLRDSAMARAAGAQLWRRRVPPGRYAYRVEASSDDSFVAVRAAGEVVAEDDDRTGFNTRGFGLSDLLLGVESSSRGAAAVPVAGFTPLLGPVPSGHGISVLWETYDLADRDGDMAFTLEITLRRRRSLRGRVIAEISGAAAAIFRADRSPDVVTFSADVDAPHRDPRVERLSIDLAETASGDYTLTVAIIDRVTGVRTSRSASFTVGDR